VTNRGLATETLRRKFPNASERVFGGEIPRASEPRTEPTRGEDATPLYNLGLSYELGIGGQQRDRAEAARLYRLAAEGGNADALVGLGRMYEDGGGAVAKDQREAARLYRLAAEKGNVWAQVHLGEMYESGLGVEEDEREAARLYKLAAEQGDPQA
jgi:TPR repeat protein